MSYQAMTYESLSEPQRREIVEVWIKICEAIDFHDIEITLYRDRGIYHASVRSLNNSSEDANLNTAISSCLEGFN